MSRWNGGVGTFYRNLLLNQIDLDSEKRNQAFYKLSHILEVYPFYTTVHYESPLVDCRNIDAVNYSLG